MALTSLYYLSQKLWLGSSKKLWTDQNSTISHTRENVKMFNISSKYFSFFNNVPPGIWLAHIRRDFLPCYSCLFYSSIIAWLKFSLIISINKFLFPLIILAEALNSEAFEDFSFSINLLFTYIIKTENGVRMHLMLYFSNALLFSKCFNSIY